MITTKPYQTELTQLMASFDDSLNRLGDKIRREVVTPACRQHKITFTSGMGTYYFSKGNDNIGSVEDPEFKRLSKAAQETVRTVLTLLDQEISHGQYLGFFVGDVP